MLDYFDVNRFNKPFLDNLKDWCLGGPRETGYTRAGPAVSLEKEIRLVGYHRKMVDIDDVLAKNRIEVERWHLSFLQGGKIDSQSPYCREYLLPRLDELQSQSRMLDVLHLLRSVENSYNPCHPVWVADMESFELGFRYFRFDGAHRACCAKVCGMKQVPAYVFTPMSSP